MNLDLTHVRWRLVFRFRGSAVDETFASTRCQSFLLSL
jgi:hypothetical protein